MKKPVPDLSWLPPREEWDFRSLTRAECRVACHWEYARETHKRVAATFRNPDEVSAVKKTAGYAMREHAKSYCPANYRQPARELFPQPWTSLTKEQRATVLGSFYPIPALQVRNLRRFPETNTMGTGCQR